jgi:phage shock protein E
VAVSDFATALKAPGTIVLDVRTPAEYASGRLSSARNLDIEGSGFAAGIAALDKNGTYAVYCHSGSRSGTALEQMSAAGFTHVYDLAGGLGAWQNMGGPMAMGGS